MKLKFQCHKIVDKDRVSIINHTVRFLQKNNYKILNEEPFTVSFIDDISGKPTLSTSYYSRVDEGKIELFEKDEQSEIVLTSGLSITAPLIQVFIIILISLCMDYSVLFFLVIPILSLLINIQIVRNNFIYDIMNI